ncbi:MAG: 4-hydroxythreonine-4-phosphate dehydrogenase PdxA [Pseudomonadota bacterium]
MSARLAITLGDPRGIGPEVVARALTDPDVHARCTPLIFGDATLLARPYVADCSEHDAALAAAAALKSGVDAVLEGRADALVTAPLHKSALLALDGGPYMGHTGYLAYRCQGTPLMVFVGPGMCLALLSIHVPVGEVPHLLTEIGSHGIARRLHIFADGLRQDLGIARPRIALLGLNPHAGEGGLLGVEEQRVLRPAIDEVRLLGIDVEGPLPADGYFGRVARDGPQHDGVVACYHDQGLVGFKTLVPRLGVQMSFGLPIVRTSVAHGTARDIAGQGRADAGSMTEALRLAIEIVDRRRLARLQ